MKLSDGTLNVLKNFSTINGNLYFKAGNIVSTIVAESHIFAQAEISENFPVDFAIYDLHKFLGALSLFQQPEIELGEKCLEIISKDESITYVYADPSTIVYPKKTKLELPEPKFSFVLSDAYVASILKTAAALSLPDLSIIADGSCMVLKVHDKKNSSSNSHKIKIDGKTADVFDIRFKIENLKILPGSYNVKVSIKNNVAVGLFENNALKVNYWISSEADSKF